MKTFLHPIRLMGLSLLTLMIWFATTLPVQAAEDNDLKDAIVATIRARTDRSEYTREQLEADLNDPSNDLWRILGSLRPAGSEPTYIDWQARTITIYAGAHYSLSDIDALNSRTTYNPSSSMFIKNYGTLTGSSADNCSNFVLENYNHVDGGKWAAFFNHGTLMNAFVAIGVNACSNDTNGRIENITFAAAPGTSGNFENYGTLSGVHGSKLVENYGEIIGDGTYDTDVSISNLGTIYGGTFSGRVWNNYNSVGNGGTIRGGTFTGQVLNVGLFTSFDSPNNPVIIGGTFSNIRNEEGVILSLNLTDPATVYNAGYVSPAVADAFTLSGVSVDPDSTLSEDQVNLLMERFVSRTPSAPSNMDIDYAASSLGRPLTLAKGASKEERPVPVHIHNYAWVVVTEPTEAENGVEEYRCTGCGEVQERIFTSAAKVYSKKVFDLIKNAEPGSTVPFETKFWTCFTKKMIDQIHEKELTLEVTFDYQHHTYTFTLKPEDDISSVEKDGYYGFLALKDLLGGYEVVKEEKEEITS